MKNVRALVLSGYGINCEQEMGRAAALAGAEVHISHTNRWLLDQIRLSDFDLLLLPGGFSFGDDLGGGKAFANRLSFSKKKDELTRFVDQGKCILGVCNGFQILVRLGILPGSLLVNERGRFESKWIRQRAPSSHCIFTTGIQELILPIRHSEGRYYPGNADPSIALQYQDNPNGSFSSISGVCDATGRVMGMMPHPEAAVHFTQLPDWTLQKERLKRSGLPIPAEGPGLKIFQNAVNYLRKK